ncbi:hypothetical protein [Aquimarina rubra]|uniref:DUF2207 domain-containing protein n=1 Tax=Aquimarina rubra TaxID=1920033 RepID=A0ABW5LIS9_9FLAO
MDNTQHCLLCDHRTQSLQSGIVCGITNQKPDFIQKCGLIKLEGQLKHRIEEVNINYKKVLQKKPDTIFHFCLFTIIGLIVLAFGFFLGFYIVKGGGLSVGPIIIIALGLGILGYAAAPLNYYRRETNNVKLLKKRTDILVDLYGLQYEIDIKIIEKKHHEIEVKKHLKISKKNSIFLK